MQPYTLPNHAVEQFSANVKMLVEQTESRLLGHVMQDTMVGEAKSIDRMGSIGDPEPVTNVYQETNLSEAEYDRRWLFATDYNLGTLVEKTVTANMLYDPKSRISQRHVSSFGRKVDDTIIEALLGSAYEGKKTGALAAVPLPAAQKVTATALGNASNKLDVAVLRGVLNMFHKNEHLTQGQTSGGNPGAVALLSPDALNLMLLNDDKATNTDTAAVKALVNGQINSFMGFQFYVTNRLPKSGNDRKIIFFIREHAVEFAWKQPITTVQTPRPDKRNLPQLLTEGAWGATRCEDTAVIEVTITE